MDTTIYDLMSSSDTKVNEFKTACDNLLNSQYILADVKITALLEAIAVSKTIYDLFDEILVDFDYKETAKNFMSNSFKLPEEPKAIACLVFCMLLDMDKKIIDLNDFLLMVQKGDINVAYEMFLEKIISPFKTSISYLLSMKQNRNYQEQAIVKEANKEEQQNYNFEKKLNVFLARIHSDSNLDAVEKGEILALGNALLIAQEQNNEQQFQRVYAKLFKKVRLYKPALLPEFENLI
ncbi:MAG: hypothetical protein FWE03_05640 [Firmicutes bacterium]|nr:hypothetical protein [Bacillota bacterium]